MALNLWNLPKTIIFLPSQIQVQTQHQTSRPGFESVPILCAGFRVLPRPLPMPPRCLYSVLIGVSIGAELGCELVPSESPPYPPTR